jgi:hypothetical protein
MTADMEAAFTVPNRMSREAVARALTAYLIGALVYTNVKNTHGDFTHGPYRRREDQDDFWQLDHTNDFWLRFGANEATMLCRDEHQAEIVQAAVALFKIRYCR